MIAGDSHWITGLTSDRTYALSQLGVNLGSRIRISRVAAGDSNVVAIHNQSGTPLVTLGSAAGLGWADFLYVANNGWVLFAKGATEQPWPDRTGVPMSRKTGSVMVPGEGANRPTVSVAELKIGCARVSTVDQDLTAQREALAALGVDPKRIYVDHGLTGPHRRG